MKFHDLFIFSKKLGTKFYTSAQKDCFWKKKINLYALNTCYTLFHNHSSIWMIFTLRRIDMWLVRDLMILCHKKYDFFLVSVLFFVDAFNLLSHFSSSVFSFSIAQNTASLMKKTRIQITVLFSWFSWWTFEMVTFIFEEDFFSWKTRQTDRGHIITKYFCIHNRSVNQWNM